MEGDLDEGPVLQLGCPVHETFFNFFLEQTALDLGFSLRERPLRPDTERLDLDDMQTIGRADHVADIPFLHGEDDFFELWQCLPSLNKSQIAAVAGGRILRVQLCQIGEIAPIPGFLQHTGGTCVHGVHLRSCGAWLDPEEDMSYPGL